MRALPAWRRSERWTNCGTAELQQPNRTDSGLTADEPQIGAASWPDHGAYPMDRFLFLNKLRGVAADEHLQFQRSRNPQFVRNCPQLILYRQFRSLSAVESSAQNFRSAAQSRERLSTSPYCVTFPSLKACTNSCMDATSCTINPPPREPGPFGTG